MNAVTSIKNEDELVFRQVFDEYHKKLYFFILSKTKSEYLAEEVVQLTFIKLWKYRTSLNEDYTISTQLFRIASTTLIDLIRKQNNSHSLIKEFGKVNADKCDNTTIEKINLKETNHTLSRALENLPPARRMVFELSRVQGLSYNEIAIKLSISPKTVENHISKAIKQLRQFFPTLLFLLFIFIVIELFNIAKIGVIAFLNVYM